MCRWREPHPVGARHSAISEVKGSPLSKHLSDMGPTLGIESLTYVCINNPQWDNPRFSYRNPALCPFREEVKWRCSYILTDFMTKNKAEGHNRVMNRTIGERDSWLLHRQNYRERGTRAVVVATAFDSCAVFTLSSSASKDPGRLLKRLR